MVSFVFVVEFKYLEKFKGILCSFYLESVGVVERG